MRCALCGRTCRKLYRHLNGQRYGKQCFERLVAASTLDEYKAILAEAR